jgi:hypothetical protein
VIPPPLLPGSREPNLPGVYRALASVPAAGSLNRLTSDPSLHFPSQQRHHRSRRRRTKFQHRASYAYQLLIAQPLMCVSTTNLAVIATSHEQTGGRLGWRAATQLLPTQTAHLNWNQFAAASFGGVEPRSSCRLCSSPPPTFSTDEQSPCDAMAVPAASRSCHTASLTSGVCARGIIHAILLVAGYERQRACEDSYVSLHDRLRRCNFRTRR